MSEQEIHIDIHRLAAENIEELAERVKRLEGWVDDVDNEKAVVELEAEICAGMRELEERLGRLEKMVARVQRLEVIVVGIFVVIFGLVLLGAVVFGGA